MNTKIAFQTHGCTNNFSESEVMAGLLKKARFEIVQKKEDADIIILNICTVKGNKTAFDAIEDVKKLNKKIILAGCIPKESYKDFRKLLPDSCFISTHNIKNIVEIAEEAKNENALDLISESKDVKINLPKIRQNKHIGIIPILTGCNHKCSYCSVKLIKGGLFSYPIDSVVREAEKCIRDRCKELWITSMDNAAYGIDQGKAMLPELLKKVAKIQGDFKIRIGMMNPGNLLSIIDEMIEVFKHPKVFKFLHMPVQSGNNEILKAMNRKYKVEEFLKIIDMFESEIPDITISTDIICGFPGETDEQFEDSIDLIKEIMPDVLNISRFVPRQRTRAYYMENQIHGNISKERSRILTNIHNNIGKMRNENWVGWKGEVVVSEKKEDWVGRSHTYKPIVIKSDNGLMGEEVKVKIIKAHAHYLIGKLI
ncbi:tRNA (N(6)-L-threonylcarbamoyladenosine(37)-C(2))-methylthiotransferase [Candidatus Woesearchaeota archaeon]|nr:tRNA (N(6)-L-threonylcarbamoyladenosine(37)-C(2))-methylthiotransferase [Candidatus Woesearchaeota archaeon]